MLSTECPRCRGVLEPVRLTLRHDGAYREAAGGSADELGWRCSGCAVGFVPGSMVESVMRRVPVGGGSAERQRRKSTTPCPGCFATFDSLVLEWKQEHVELERCPRFGGLLLDPGELSKVFQIEQRARKSLP
jgi:Zn-finger nucleic acid-binding protein